MRLPKEYKNLSATSKCKVLTEEKCFVSLVTVLETEVEGSR